MVQIKGLLVMAILLYDMFQLQNVQIHTLSMLFPRAICCTRGYMIGSVCLSVCLSVRLSVCLSVSPSVCDKKNIGKGRSNSLYTF